METKDYDDIEQLYKELLKLPIKSIEYRKCIEKIRLYETGMHTLGQNLSLEPVAPNGGCIDINISKVL